MVKNALVAELYLCQQRIDEKYCNKCRRIGYEATLDSKKKDSKERIQKAICSLYEKGNF